ncbi:PSD1 and planctomycete cytochrome C domain-containing protein [Calycomorphotria hydatis]|nr:PSD1 and planctomycete cytochrome C domain-containing protein [Calycomorphotria hydatis]
MLRVRTHRRFLLLTCVVAFAAFIGLQAVLQAAGPQDQKIAFFEERIRPLLLERCIECHGGELQESSLRLDSRDSILKGGISGPAMVAKHPDKSLLISAVRYDGLEMPPEEQLSDREIADLTRWVKMGAPWPSSDVPTAPALGDQEAIGEIAESHWAFQPMKSPAVPAVSSQDRVGNPVDAFILQQLEEEGLSLSSPADRRTLIRRAYIDVIGLPPTQQQIARFVNDSSPNAFEKVIEELLASPHYGERWGRHWLDIARYADTRDWQAAADVRYPFAYTYRDYVINAFNSDLPYDQFIKEQLAADFYTDDAADPKLSALGFLTVGPRFRNNRFEDAADKIDVMTRGLMGLTVTCARCHDHKYDPIPTADYYSLYGVLASCEIPETFPVIRADNLDAELAAEFNKARQEKIDELDGYADSLIAEAQEDILKKLPTYFDSYVEMDVTKKLAIRGAVTKYKVTETAMMGLINHFNEVEEQSSGQYAEVFSPWREAMTIPAKAFPRRIDNIVKGWESSEELNAILKQELLASPIKKPADVVQAYARAFQAAVQGWKPQFNDEGVLASDASAPKEIEQLRASLFGPQGLLIFSRDEMLKASKLTGKGRGILKKYESAILEVEATHPGSPPRAMTIADKPEPVTPFVMLRGEPNRKGDRVPRRFLSILSGDDAKEFAKDSSGRRELAESIADHQNPLTARVLINRVWMTYFGKGFVATPGDFGLRCDPPTHPELLDWLALDFIEHDWSLKHLHRRILLSSTYQQASDPNPAASKIDPENQLLWKMNRKRLDLEAMRDSMLAASGEIDLTIGGHSVQLSEQPYSTRRTLYGYIDRVELDPIFTTFDFPSPDSSAPVRTETTVPQQALFTMNHPFVVEQAKALARLAEEVTEKPSARVQFMYRRLVGRNATPDEIKLALRFYRQASKPIEREDSVWSYGYGPAVQAEGSEDQFQILPFWSGRTYQGGKEYPDPKLKFLMLDADGGHVGHGLQKTVIRRWTSPINGFVSIHAKLEHRRKRGDGVHAQIVLNRHQVLGEWEVLDKVEETSLDRIKVQQGDTLDFAVDCIKTIAFDSFDWAPVITVVAGPQKSLAWDANREFAAPPPPLLGELEQLAQALMLTNEFMYID